MFKQLADWLDDRTGFRALMKEALDEPIPGGVRWRYVFGSALTVVFMVQAFTGILLMMSYSPSSSTAWASVFYISREMWCGWFIRGVHHFAAQAMVVLLVLHLLQVLWAGRLSPARRELNWWFGMGLLFLTLAFSLTGYLLPWDQKGYWATKVATNIMGGAPGIGPYLQKVVVGGSDYGNQTVTRFYGLHVGVLPALLVVFLAAHGRGCFAATASPLRARCRRWATPDRHLLARAAFHGYGLQRGRARGGDRAGDGRGRREPRRAGRPRERRLSGPAGVVFLVALPDAQALSRQPRSDWHHRDPDRAPDRHAPLALSGPGAAGQGRPFSGMRLRIRGRGGRRFPDGPGHPGRRPRRCVSAGQRSKPTRPAAALSSSPDRPMSESRPTARPISYAEIRSLKAAPSCNNAASAATPLKPRVAAHRRPPTSAVSDPGLGFAACWNNPALADLLRQSRQVRRHGRVETELEAQPPSSLTTWRISSHRLPQIPAGHDPRGLAQQQGGRRPSGARTVPQRMRDLSLDRSAQRRHGRCATSFPQLFGWGVAALDHAHDPQPTIIRQHTASSKRQAGQNQMPAFGPDQITAGDLDVVVPLSERRIRQRRMPASVSPAAKPR